MNITDEKAKIKCRLTEAALESVIKTIKKTGIPIIYGKFSTNNCAIIKVEDPSLQKYIELIKEDSICVVDAIKKEIENNEKLMLGFDLSVRLGNSNTWIQSSIHLFDEEDCFDDDEHIEDNENSFDHKEIVNARIKLSAIIATSDGFESVALKPNPRKEFSLNIARDHIQEFIDIDANADIDIIAEQCSYTAMSYWEFYVIPMRANKLKEKEYSISEISKKLGITKARAEKSIKMAKDIGKGINSNTIKSLIEENDKWDDY